MAFMNTTCLIKKDIKVLVQLVILLEKKSQEVLKRVIQWIVSQQL